MAISSSIECTKFTVKIYFGGRDTSTREKNTIKQLVKMRIFFITIFTLSPQQVHFVHKYGNNSCLIHVTRQLSSYIMYQFYDFHLNSSRRPNQLQQIHSNFLFTMATHLDNQNTGVGTGRRGALGGMFPHPVQTQKFLPRHGFHSLILVFIMSAKLHTHQKPHLPQLVHTVAQP